MMKYIKLFEAYISEKEKEQKDPWWKKYTKYKLSAYPVNIPKEDVTIDMSGDIDTHPVMTWISPTTGYRVHSYTKARMDAQKEKKYARLENLTDEEVEHIKAKCHDDILSPETDETTKESAAIISIIAQTGLRPGSMGGFLQTKNRGVITLSKDNIKIDGDKITLNFVGKSYQDNTAEIKDGTLAHYLETRTKNDTDFIFDVSNKNVENYYHKTLKMDKFKIKDLRTYTAGKVAREFLENDPASPPPVPTKSSEIKKMVKSKLKRAFEYVSKKLNNTPAMAKNSYVNPAIITDWLDSIGIKPVVISEETEKDEAPIDFIGNAPVYKMPRWWDDDEIELKEVE